jgi:hypothetical protein
MRWLFVLLIGAFIVGDVFQWSLSLATGVSVKNAVLYLIGLALFFRIALGESGKGIRLPGLHLAFFLLVTYATLSWIVTFTMLNYSGYSALDGLITLKTRLIDPALMLFAAFYAIRDQSDARFILMCLLAGVGFANLATLADAAGIVHLGMRIGDHGEETGRVFGVFGHANDTGTFIVCMLPAMVATTWLAKGAQRVLWLGCALVSGMVLILTVSRGAFAGLFIGGLWAAWVCRRYVPLQRIVAFGIVICIFGALAVLIATLVEPAVGNLLADRLIGNSKAYDLGNASSGRTEIWWQAISRMLRTPISFLSGFGWGVYDAMPFHYAPHNYYLGTWFDLGVFGVGLFVFILVRVVLTSCRSLPYATPEVMPQLLASIFGMLGMAVAILFTDFLSTWPYVWLYVGVFLKMAVLARDEALQPRPERLQPAPAIVRSAPSAFGGVFAGRPH